jgi:hypothetical protein
LLHIIGLEEHKEKSKKLIGRKSESSRDSGSILENAINILHHEDCLSGLDKSYINGVSKEEQLYNVALELSITWINRILFLKLLEGQLIKYHKGDQTYTFLNENLIPDYDALNRLFFHVLAVRENERGNHVKELFSKVPYLNSSLFEPNELEHKTIRISNLEDDYEISILNATVLKDNTGKKLSGKKNPLHYLFEFLDAYDFSSEGSEEISEENKTLINASVLGLIFEKINGYKDGSFFTPGFITMYMARETISRAIVQKFNDAKGWNAENLDELYNKIDDKKEANEIINSLKVCDPAVGSGHFLVSVLNEIISAKSQLEVLVDSEGRRLKNYHIEVINDELVITDEDGEFFEYHPGNSDSQRVQETLFREKQTIIENCLFGVDINPNSVKICRLRLWIELLKNSYYKKESGFKELETLPNIDINIKCGNSLISRYPLDADIKQALRKSKWTIESYKLAIMSYRNAPTKEVRATMHRLIDEIKSDFESEVSKSDKRYIRLNTLKGQLYEVTNQKGLYKQTTEELTEWNKKVKKLTDEISKLENELEEIKNNKIFDNAFEWRFEFPEVLNNDGVFVGFDVVIGNPPYMRQEEFSELKPFLKNRFKVYHSIADLLTYFVELGSDILNSKGTFQFIISNKFTRTDYGKVLRNFLISNTSLTQFIDFSGLAVFDGATVDAAIIGFDKEYNESSNFTYANILKSDFELYGFEITLSMVSLLFKQSLLSEHTWAIESPQILEIKRKIEEQGIPIKEWGLIFKYGIKTGCNEAYVIDRETKENFQKKDPKSVNILKPILRGRDIKKYYPEFQDLWLINVHNGIKENGLKPIEINDFPIIKEHLNQYYNQLSKKSDQGVTHYNLRNCSYLDDFERPKIIFPNMTKFMPFVIDLDLHYYHNDKSFHIICDRIYWLGAFLNSKLFKYCFKDNFAELLGGTRELRKVFFEPIPVKQLSVEEEKPFKEKILQILELKKKDPESDTMIIEQEIDQMIYKVYCLNEAEIKIVEDEYNR